MGAIRRRDVRGRRLKWLGGLLLAALLLSKPQAAALGALEAMAHWQASVAPAVFPFLTLMPLLTCREAARAYERALGRAMGALFRLPGAAASAMAIGMIAGTPAVAVAARRVAAEAGMDRGQLQRLAVGAMGFSPAFLVGGVGAGMLGSAQMGWRLVVSQLLAQLSMALLLRGVWRERAQPVEVPAAARAENPVRGAVTATLSICGYMALFASFARAAGAWLGQAAGGALLCLMDVPSGARLVSGLELPVGVRLVLLAALCGFGSVCLIAQCRGALGDCAPGWGACLALRALAGLLAAGFMALQLRLANGAAPRLVETLVSNPLASAGLCASLLAIPALIKLQKSIS